MFEYTKLAFHVVKAAGIKKTSAESGAPQDGKKGIDWKWGLGGTLGLASAPSHALNKLYASDFMAPLTREKGAEEISLGQKLRQMATTNGTEILEDSVLPTAYHPNFPGINKPTIFIGKWNTPGAIAHEIGHHQGAKGLLKLRMSPLAPVGVLGGLGGAMFTKNEDTARRNALIGSTAAAVGHLPSEIDASVRGYKLMKSLGSTTRPALKSFSGLPTYALTSALPLIGYGMKKFMGGYDKPQGVVSPVLA